MTDWRTSADLRDCLSAVYGDWCDGLLGSRGQHRLETAAQGLPSALMLHQLGFECELTADSKQVDLLVAARKAQNGAALLQETAETALTGTSHPAWLSVRQLAASWQNAPWSELMDDVWLEFDVNGPEPRVPNLFVGPGITTADSSTWDQWLETIGAMLLGSQAGQGLVRDFHRCRNALPEAAQIFQVGAMRARPADGLRLCVSHIYLDAILDYLPKIGLDQGEQLCASLIELQKYAQGFTLHIDVPIPERPRLALECYLADPDDFQGWKSFIMYLCKHRLCTSSKMTSVLRYPGLSKLGERDGCWPESASKFPPGLLGTSALRQRIHHIKLDFEGGVATRAKVYLSVTHEWVR